MADSLELKEAELDYEAEEVEENVETPTPRDDTPTLTSEETGDRNEDNAEKTEETTDTAKDDHLPDVSTDLINSPAQDDDADDGELEDDEEEEGKKETDTKDDDDGKLESGEELEDGEISDEDEALKNERLEPKAVCRFFSKGQCTWGASCRFLHPGVLDKGNYSMFAAPRPILPGESSEEADKKGRKEEPVLVPAKVPEHETAWERGMRQAKEMRRRSNKRRENDVEYEEKKTGQSLTQLELDKENDYYMRPASPAHTHDPYGNDNEDYYNDRDPYDTYHPEVRRVAPPPPPEFIAREERERSRYHESRPPQGHPGPGPRPRRIAPPRSPSPNGPPPARGGRVAPPPPPHHGHPPHGPPPGPGHRFRGGEDWADPWMRGGGGERGRPQAGGGRSADRYGRKRSYSSGSSRSSSGSSRSRSPRRRRRYSSSYSSRSSSRSRSRSSTPAGIPRRHDSKVKKEPGSGPKNTAPLQKRLAGVSGKHKERRSRGDDSSDDERRNRESRGEKGKDNKPREPFKMNIPKNQLKLSLKGAGPSKSSGNNEIFEKPGEEPPPKKSLKRKSDDNDAVKQQAKLASMKSKIDAISKSAEKIKTEKTDQDKKSKAAAAALAGADTKGRREELLKQLRAVEEAIHRKRSKLDK